MESDKMESMMAQRSERSSYSGVSLKSNGHSSLPRMVKRRTRSSHSDVPFKSYQSKNILNLIRQRSLTEMDQGSMESLESNDSGLSFKSDQSKGGLINFKDSSSPRCDIANDEDFFESSDDLGQDDPGVSGLKCDGNIIEAPVSSCF